MGISKWNAGIIRPVPVAPEGPYQEGAAPGVWTLDQVAYWQKQGLWPIAGNATPNYIEDMFSTWLYTGNGTTQTITNGVNLSGKGGLVWSKSRSSALSHVLVDTVRGSGLNLSSDTTAAQSNPVLSVTSFLANGYTLGSRTGSNDSGVSFASWTFREQPKFFDVVTYTGTGVARTIAHNLNSVPGCIIVKRTDVAQNWAVQHRGAGGGTQRGNLNNTNQFAANAFFWNNTDPTSTVFTVGTSDETNASGSTYVAYLFAHNAGGFGLTGTDNVISCGSYTGNGTATGPTVTLGYEPQWIMVKSSSAASNWIMLDNMRGVPTGGFDSDLYANLTYVGSPTIDFLEFTSTGFIPKSNNSETNGSGATYIYIAIRRGPMKVPTLGTSVFSPIAANNAQGTENTTGFPLDMQILNIRGGYGNNGVTTTRLIGVSSNTTSSGTYLRTPSTAAELSNNPSTQYWSNTGFQTASEWASSGMIYWSLRRAPGFFDVVCYTGTGANTTQAHNLAVAPEMMIVKKRSSATTSDWFVYHSGMVDLTYTNPATQYIRLNLATDWIRGASGAWNNTQPTSSVLSLGDTSATNASGQTFVAYLFATAAGVSKVGSYTGTGALQTVACGFTTGTRFVLIKRADAVGDWYVWDSARGISSGTDPYLLLNSTAAEVTVNNYVDTDTTGFKVTAAAPAALNASGGTYIFLAIA